MSYEIALTTQSFNSVSEVLVKTHLVQWPELHFSLARSLIILGQQVKSLRYTLNFKLADVALKIYSR